MNTDFFAIRRLAAGGLVVVLACLSLMNAAPAQASGEIDFNTYCGACHSIGQGRRVGPDLAGVHDRRSQEWLEKFIKSSQSLIKSGDAEAVAIAAEYNNLIMPDAIISAAQIKDILTYIQSAGSGAAAAVAAEAAEAGSPAPQAAEAAPEPAAAPLSEADIKLGQQLFEGSQRLENGGPACNACHHVLNDAVMGGGILATELTKAFSRMGVPGLKAVIGSAPYPVMQAAYKDQALTEEEVAGLVAFLQYADAEEYNQLPRDYGMGLFLTGIVGAAVLFILFGTVWRGRKTGSVNQAIYDRQVKSVSDA
jgi:cytochrome c2